VKVPLRFWIQIAWDGERIRSGAFPQPRPLSAGSTRCKLRNACWIATTQANRPACVRAAAEVCAASSMSFFTT
jgi:hypothetical protein